jgi:ADP-ribose pyrophosphatase
MTDIWKTLSVKTAYDTPWLKLKLETVDLGDGTIIEDYQVVEYYQVVFVFALTTEHEVLLVRQYRQGAKAITLEIPGGGAGKDENLMEAAKRELLEETGYHADNLELLGTIPFNAARCSNYHTFFLARAATKLQLPSAEELTERTEIVRVDLAQLYQMAIKGEINSMSSLAGVFLALARLQTLAFNHNLSSGFKGGQLDLT